MPSFNFLDPFFEEDKNKDERIKIRSIGKTQEQAEVDEKRLVELNNEIYQLINVKKSPNSSAWVIGAIPTMWNERAYSKLAKLYENFQSRLVAEKKRLETLNEYLERVADVGRTDLENDILKQEREISVLESELELLKLVSVSAQEMLHIGVEDGEKL